MVFEACSQELESQGPLTGLGLFKIERSTLTGMVSTAITYIIILIQFRTVPESTETHTTVDFTTTTDPTS